MKHFSLGAFLFGAGTALVSYAIFLLLTLTVGWETQLRNRTNSIGVPYAFYEWGGVGSGRFIPSGFFADLAIVAVYCMIVGMLFSFLWKVRTTHYVE